MLILVALLACSHKPPVEPAAPPAPAEPPSGKLGPEATQAQKYGADFQTMWKTLDSGYCCWAEKATDWPRVRTELGPRAEAAPTDLDFLAIIDLALDQLYDPATDLRIPPKSAWRPRSVDIWARYVAGVPTIVGVKIDSAARRQAVTSGRILDRIDSQPVEARSPRAGPRSSPIRIPRPTTGPCVRRWRAVQPRPGARHAPPGGRRSAFTTIKELDKVVRPAVERESFVAGAALVTIHTFEDPQVVALLDQALDAIGASTTLVIDVRDNPGGDLALAQQALGRFARASTTVLTTDGPGAKGPIVVSPRGAWQVTAPVIVLTNYWTVGAAEAFAVGLDVLGARVIGTRMGGEGVVVDTLTLPNTGYDVSYATARLLDPSGTPVSAFVPETEVDMASKPHGDAIKEAARAGARGEIDRPSRGTIRLLQDRLLDILSSSPRVLGASLRLLPPGRHALHPHRLEPEGWRRQDDDGDQPRVGPRGARPSDAGGGHGPAGQRVVGPRHPEGRRADGDRGRVARISATWRACSCRRRSSDSTSSPRRPSSSASRWSS
jgi:carboxyl-terminal processing protease